MNILEILNISTIKMILSDDKLSEITNNILLNLQEYNNREYYRVRFNKYGGPEVSPRELIDNRYYKDSSIEERERYLSARQHHPVLNSSPRIVSIPVGYTLYHTSPYKFEYPNTQTNYFFNNVNSSEGALWFFKLKTNPDQKYIYRYKYVTTEPLKMYIIEPLYDFQDAHQYIQSHDSKYQNVDIIHDDVVLWFSNHVNGVVRVDGIIDTLASDGSEFIIFNDTSNRLLLIDVTEISI
jgi:hypothetical protein